MYYTITVLLLLSMFLLQFLRNRLVTATTLWLGYYFCFFVLSPSLLQFHDPLTDQYACWYIVVFFIGYLYISLCYKPIRWNLPDFLLKPLKPNYGYLNVIVILTGIALLLYIGTSGLSAVLHGNLTSRSLMTEHTSIFRGIYLNTLGALEFSLVLIFIAQRGKFKLKHWLFLLIYAIQMILFSFTRSPLILCIVMLMIYKLRYASRFKQIKVLIAGVFSTMVLMTTMLWIRVFGLQEGLKHFSWSRMFANLADNLDFAIGYQSLIQLLHHPVHITGLVYLKPLFAVIPRSLWAAKPFRGSIEILQQLNPEAAAAGYSTGYTILGVAFAVFGKLGFIISPLFWAFITGILDTQYKELLEEKNDHNLCAVFYIYFAVIFVLQGFREGTDVAFLKLPTSLCFFLLVLLPTVRLHTK